MGTQTDIGIRPVTVQFTTDLGETETFDAMVSFEIPLAEILPAIARQCNHLSQEKLANGLMLRTEFGKELSLNSSFSQQGIIQGSRIRLETLHNDDDSLKYDDLVEAIGQTVNKTQKPWTRDDSVLLSSLGAATLFVLAGVLMLFAQNSQPYYAATAIAASIILGIFTVLTVRMSIPTAAIALAITSSFLMGTSAYLWLGGAEISFKLIGAAVGVAVGSISIFGLPDNLRATIVAPLTASATLAIMGACLGFGLSSELSAAIALVPIVVAGSFTSRLSMLLMPARIAALSENSNESWSPQQIDTQLTRAKVFAISFRVSVATIAVLLTPIVATSGYGIALTSCVGLIFFLGTRQIVDRKEVLVEVCAGALVLLLTCWQILTATEQSIPWLLLAALTIAAIALITNVLVARRRPRLASVADIGQIVLLICLIPLVVMIAGII